MTPDSFLLGECNSPGYGTLKADLLTQFACPIDAIYPDSCELDSVCLFLYYRTWYGNGDAPLRINAYEIDSEPLCYDSLYTSDVDIQRFVSPASRAKSVLERPYVLSAAHPDYGTVSNTYNGVAIKLTDEYARKVFETRDFSSQQAFQQKIKGLYITTDYGTSTILYINNVSLVCYFHYTYKISAHSDTYAVLRDSRIFPANSEVRQVNHYTYPDVSSVRQRLCQSTDTNYIISPANLYACLKIPVEAMRQSIGRRTVMKRPYINLASLEVDVLNYPNTELDAHAADWAHPAKSMMLIKESAFSTFFKSHQLPSDTCAICSDLITSVDSTDTYRNYYAFDLSKIFSKQVRDSSVFVDTLRMLLVPVSLTYTASQYSASTQTVSEVHIEQSVTLTEIRSALDAHMPMDVELVYTGMDTIPTWGIR